MWFSAEYADYHQAMAQHAASLANSNQLHNIGQLGQIQMQQLMSSGLNLTVSSAAVGYVANASGGFPIYFWKASDTSISNMLVSSLSSN